MANAASPRDVRKAKQKERLARDQARKDLADVLSTTQGRRFIWKRLTEAGCFRLSFVPGDADATAFNEGRRSLGLALMAEIHALDPAAYVHMAREAQNEEPQNEEEASTVEPEPTTEDPS